MGGTGRNLFCALRVGLASFAIKGSCPEEPRRVSSQAPRRSYSPRTRQTPAPWVGRVRGLRWRLLAGRSACATRLRVTCGSADVSLIVWSLDMFYSSLLDARLHRNHAGGGASAGIFAGSSQPRRNFDVVRFLAASGVDCRFFAGNVVTELRAAHGSGRVDQGRDCASGRGTGFYRGGKAEWSL